MTINEDTGEDATCPLCQSPEYWECGHLVASLDRTFCECHGGELFDREHEFREVVERAFRAHFKAGSTSSSVPSGALRELWETLSPQSFEEAVEGDGLELDGFVFQRVLIEALEDAGVIEPKGSLCDPGGPGMTSSVSLLFAERPQDCIKKALALLRLQLAVQMFFVTQAIQGASERNEERQFIICEKSEIKRRQDVEVISVGFKTAASAKAFAKKLVGKLHPKEVLFLDFWEEDGKDVWSWKDERTGGASQVFKSKKGALGAWRRNRLIFTKLLD